MPTIERSDGNPTWKMTYDVNGFENSQLFHLFMARVTELNQVVPLTKFTVDRDDQNPQQWTYKFTAVDGRTWVQDYILVGGDFSYTIKATGMGFQEQVIQAHTALRIIVGGVILTHNIDKIKVEWA